MAGSSKKGAAWSWRRLALGAVCVGGLGAAGYVGSLFLPRATAQPAAPTKPVTPTPAQPAAAATPSDYSTRPVAFLHGNETITREQLGEYLIARYGADKLPLLVNKLIIEEACKAKGIDVTPAEVEASFAQGLAGMGSVSEQMFVDNVLKQYKKTLFEWKEDVVRPKLLMSKLVRDRVKVTEEEIQACYDAHYGEKVDCKMIYWPRGEKEQAIKIWGLIRDSKDVDREFDNRAVMQASPRLAANTGHLDQPIGRHTTGDEKLEALVFGMQPGQMSGVEETRDGIVVVKCLQRIPPDTTVSLEKVRPTLYKEVFEKKVQMEIPIVFMELQKQAKADLLLKDPHKQLDLTETTQQALSGGKPAGPAKDVVPASGAH